MFGQACITTRHVPQNTCCRHKPTLPLHDDKRVSNKPAYTPEHKSTWNYSYPMRIFRQLRDLGVKQQRQLLSPPL